MEKFRKCPNVSLECLQTQTIFYCCGLVISKSNNYSDSCPFEKRHGMSGKCFNSSNIIENAREVYENDLTTEKITNPGMPYSGKIPFKLYNGMTIQVKGNIPKTAGRFAINLATEIKNDCDIAFHFNPRFDRRIVVRNTRKGGSWQEEEIACARPFPFIIGRNLTIIIFVADGQFMVAVNNKHYCNYTYRIPINRICNLDIDGDLSLLEIAYSESFKYPNLPSTRSPRVMVPSDNGNIKIKKINRGITVGTKIKIKGQVKLLPYEFYINLQIGSTQVPHPIIPLHINLRLCRPGLLEQQIICNSWINGSWESEIKPPYCPFLPGMNFVMSIYYLEDGFTVYVNDQFLVGFPLRLPYPPGIDTLLVEGDVNIFSVVIKKIPKGFLL